METFSSRLAFLLEKLGMTQRDLCNSTGLSQGAISKYLNAKQEPKSKELRLISVALEVTMDSWFEDNPVFSSTAKNSEWKVRATDAERKLGQFRSAIKNFAKVVEHLEGAM